MIRRKMKSLEDDLSMHISNYIAVRTEALEERAKLLGFVENGLEAESASLTLARRDAQIQRAQLAHLEEQGYR